MPIPRTDEDSELDFIQRARRRVRNLVRDLNPNERAEDRRARRRRSSTFGERVRRGIANTLRRVARRAR